MFDKIKNEEIYEAINRIEDMIQNLENALENLTAISEVTEDDIERNKLHIQKIIESSRQTIIDCLNDVKNVLLMQYEDISAVRPDIERILHTLNAIKTWPDAIEKEKYKTIGYVENIIADSKEKIRDDIVRFTDEIKEALSERNELLMRNEELSKRNEELEKAIESLSASFAIVAQGIYNQDNIEFAAVKTYREGWRYICYNGRQLTEFDDISDITLSWSKDEQRVAMDIVFN